MKKQIITCDVCASEKDIISDRKIQVIFLTEQTEGRSCKPHLSDEILDICNVCLEKILEGNYLYGSGAQGYNKYFFKSNE